MQGLNKIDPICFNPIDVQLNPAKYKRDGVLDHIYGGGQGYSVRVPGVPIVQLLALTAQVRQYFWLSACECELQLWR